MIDIDDEDEKLKRFALIPYIHVAVKSSNPGNAPGTLFTKWIDATQSVEDIYKIIGMMIVHKGPLSKMEMEYILDYEYSSEGFCYEFNERGSIKLKNTLGDNKFYVHDYRGFDCHIGKFDDLLDIHQKAMKIFEENKALGKEMFSDPHQLELNWYDYVERMKLDKGKESE